MRENTIGRVYLFIVFSFAGFLLLQSSVAVSGRFIDRMVLEINKISYSQRQFEVYSALKNAIHNDGASQQVQLVSSDNWSRLLNEFKDQMIIEQEAMRLSSIQATPAQLSQHLEVIEQQKNRNIIFSDFLNRYGVDESEIRQVLTSILRVEGYIEGRQGAEKTSEAATDLQNTDWFQKLMQRSVYRSYEGAAGYQAIYPNQLSPSQSGNEAL